MTTSVAVCTHRRYTGLVTTLASLAAQQGLADEFEILIIDNAPSGAIEQTEGIQELLAKLNTVRIISEPRIGVAHARNRALDECRTKYLAFLDDDCVASTGWLSSMLSAAHSSSNIGAIGGKVCIQTSQILPEWIHEEMVGYLSLLDLGNEMYEILPSQHLVGGNILYNVDALRSIGGFSSHLGRIGDILLSNEEVDVFRRMRRVGLRLIYQPDALVEHSVPSKRLCQEWFRRRMFWQAVSDVLMNSDLPLDQLLDDQGAGLLSSRVRHTSTVELLSEVDVPEQLWAQLKRIYNLTILLALHAVAEPFC